MSRKVLVSLVIVLITFSIVLSGCGPQQKDTEQTETEVTEKVQPVETKPYEQTQEVAVAVPSAVLALSFQQGDSTTYKSSTDTIQDYKFEQPSKNEVKEEQSRTLVEMKYSQDIQSVTDSSAVAKITIDAIKVLIKERNEVKLDFDSTRDEDKASPLSQLIGKGYTINIASDGKVTKVTDTDEIRRAVKSGYEAQVAKKIILDDQNIIKRHEIVSLPDTENAEVTEGESWSRIVPSHKRLLEQKSFEKRYTLENINEDKQVAKVEMEASETDKPAPGAAPSGGFGIMARMFDTQETYEGVMKFDLASDKVIKSDEKFVATYIATDKPKTEGAAPPSLVMGLTHHVVLEKVD